MDEREQGRGGSGCAIGIGLVLASLPVLYVLGLGPAAWIASHYPATNDFLESLYYPLQIAARSWDPIAQGLSWYLRLWV
jgi:hypothetical protein